MKKLVTDYLVTKEVEGWVFMDSIIPDHFGYFHVEDGLQIIFSIKDYGLLNILHVSVNPVRNMRKDLTDKEHEVLIIEKAPSIVRAFFGERDFAKKPSDPRNPIAKNFFALLGIDE